MTERKADGVHPAWSRKKRVKCDGALKPSRSLTEVMGSCVETMDATADSSRSTLRKTLGVTPVDWPKRRKKCARDRPAAFASLSKLGVSPGF